MSIQLADSSVSHGLDIANFFANRFTKSANFKFAILLKKFSSKLSNTWFQVCFKK